MTPTLKGIFTGVVIGIVALCSPDAARALSLNVGTPVIAIDGNSDQNVTVSLLSLEGSSYFEYGYFLNGSSAFTALPSMSPISSFQGGDIIDFALHRLGTDKIYSLSGDSSDQTYQVTMHFAGEVTAGSPQQPADWNSPYFYGAVLGWDFSDYGDLKTGEVVIELPSCWKCTPNDGIAPYRPSVRVSEPMPLLLLGLGLFGLGLLRLKQVA